MSAYLLKRMMKAVKEADGGKGHFTDFYIAETEKELTNLIKAVEEAEKRVGELADRLGRKGDNDDTRYIERAYEWLKEYGRKEKNDNNI